MLHDYELFPRKNPIENRRAVEDKNEIVELVEFIVGFATSSSKLKSS